MKISKRKLQFAFVAVIGLTLSLIFFQNCSSRHAFTVVEPSVQATPEPIAPVVVGPRTKVILPEVSSTTQINHKVKVLLVVDNSATMGASQTNLSNQISVLLEKLSSFDSEIQVVSSSYQADDGRSDLQENILFTTINTSTPKYIQGYLGTSDKTELVENTMPVFQLKPGQSTAERQASILAISNRIKALGVLGSSSEAPFAVAALQGAKFFNAGDRGLIFIITDEDDKHSIDKLSQPIFSVRESANTGEMEEHTYTTIRNEVTISTTSVNGQGDCNVPIYGQDGIITGYQNEYVSMSFFNMQSCESYTRCSLSCSTSTTTSTTSGFGPCSSVYVFPGSTLDSCSESSSTTTYQTERTVSGDNQEIFPFGLTKQQISNFQGGAQALFLNEFKSKVLSKFNEKYHISVFANLANQTCATSSGQSRDTFFTSLKGSFPEPNFSLTSICGNNTSYAEKLDKIATDFLNIMNTKYLVGLASNEKIKSARIKLVNANTMSSIVEGQDYKVERGELILLKPNLFDFERIELEIENF